MNFDLRCDQLAKVHLKKYQGMKLALQENSFLEGKLYSCHSIFRSRLGGLNNIISLDRNWKYSLDLELQNFKNRGKAVKYHSIRAQGRHHFRLIQRNKIGEGLQNEEEISKINIFALRVIKSFENVYRSEIKPIIMICSRLEKGRKELKFFHSRNKKVLKMMVVGGSGTNIENKVAEVSET